MKKIKTTRRGLEIAAETWTKGDEVIVLHGAMHIAEPSFWNSIHDRLEESAADGYELHLEGVKPIPEGTALSPTLQAAQPALARVFQMQVDAAALAGLTSQKEGIGELTKQYGSTDVTQVDVLGALNMKATKKIMKTKGSYFEDIEKASPGMSGKMLVFMFRHLPLMNSVFRFNTKILDTGVVLDFRNHFAINSALASDSPKRYLFWGAAHLPGMGRLLRMAGFKRTRTEWFLAISAGHRAPKPNSDAYKAAIAQIA